MTELLNGPVTCNVALPRVAVDTLRPTVERSGIAVDEIDDTAIGTGLAAGLPASVAGQTVVRQRSSALMAIAAAAKQIVVDEMRVVAASGEEKLGALGPVRADGCHDVEPVHAGSGINAGGVWRALPTTLVAPAARPCRARGRAQRSGLTPVRRGHGSRSAGPICLERSV